MPRASLPSLQPIRIQSQRNHLASDHGWSCACKRDVTRHSRDLQYLVSQLRSIDSHIMLSSVLGPRCLPGHPCRRRKQSCRSSPRFFAAIGCRHVEGHRLPVVLITHTPRHGDKLTAFVSVSTLFARRASLSSWYIWGGQPCADATSLKTQTIITRRLNVRQTHQPFPPRPRSNCGARRNRFLRCAIAKILSQIVFWGNSLSKPPVPVPGGFRLRLKNK